jgi:hypothetical protein
MFRPTLNMKPYFCFSPWFDQCHKPARNSAEVEAHWEPLLLKYLHSLTMLQTAARGSNKAYAQSTATDYFEQQDEMRANYTIWGRAREAQRIFEAYERAYASELAYALHYERLERKAEEDKIRDAEREREMAAFTERLRLQGEEEEAKAAAALSALPPTLSPATLARIRYCLLTAIRQARWNGQPRAMRRLLKGLPLVEAGI